ncbi:hypothetical protein MMC06_003353 [Schaereria dolodes]|nr:hypothetical protein [Schaereria dolodes]
MRQELDVLIAVVDRISSPSTHILRQAKLDPLNKTMSSEGISVLVTDSKKAAPDLWSTRKEAYESETTSIQQRCTLSFQFQPSTHDISASFRRHWTPVPYSSQTLDLPLTNTLFQNGRTSTLEAQRWAVTGILNSKPELSRTRRSVLPQQSLKIQRNCEQLSLAKLEIPLFYITPPRIVADSMGNIIRSFRDDGNSRGTVSASEELERAVKLETAEGEREACRIDVWALVIPREYWISQPRAMVQLNAVIESGGRLHRVLSGGGGWGNKQGLLSLEPDSMFTMSSKDPQTGFDDGFDFEAEKREALGEVARPGDVVQFLGRKDKGESRRLDFEEIENPLAMEINGLSSIVLGCIPSKMDTLPAYHVTNRNTTNQPYYLFIHNHFGALSEQGLGLGIETHGPKDTATFGAQSLGLVVQTKLPPNSIFRIENVNGRVDAKLVNQDKAKHNVVKLDTVKLNEL